MFEVDGSYACENQNGRSVTIVQLGIGHAETELIIYLEKTMTE